MTNGLPYDNLLLYLVLFCVCSWLTLLVFFISVQIVIRIHHGLLYIVWLLVPDFFNVAHEILMIN